MNTLERLIITDLLLKLILCIALVAVAYAVCGCEDKQPLSEWHWDVIIEEKRAEGYYISTITMKKKVEAIPTYSQRIHWDEYADFCEIIDCNFVMSDPNEASYKAFFGWE